MLNIALIAPNQWRLEAQGFEMNTKVIHPTSSIAFRCLFGAHPPYRYPDGFIVPLAVGLRALLKTEADGKLVWKTDPSEFIEKHLDEIVRKYKVLIQAFGGDAQKIGKNEGSYALALDAFETELLKLGQNS